MFIPRLPAIAHTRFGKTLFLTVTEKAISVDMNYKAECSVCHRHTANLLGFACPICGGPLEVKLRDVFNRKKVFKKNFSIWRYKRFFPYIKNSDITTLGEGWTPLVRFSKNIRFKLEYLNPTGSFKDRGSSVLVSAIHKSVKVKGGYIAEDSSGNAGASVAAYTARAGLKARIYVPENVSGAKLGQIRMYNANIVKAKGSRSHVAEEAQRNENGKSYIGHALHPVFRDGIRTLAYEIVEQTDGQIPDYIYLPTSAGTLLLGVISGLRHLADSGVIESPPTIVACQTRQVSPLYSRFKGTGYQQPTKVTSIADALVSVNPPLLDLMTIRLREMRGDAVVVDETETVEAYKKLAGKGFFVEPSSAVAYAAYIKHSKNEKKVKNRAALIVLTGIGLKTTFNPYISKFRRNPAS